MSAVASGLMKSARSEGGLVTASASHCATAVAAARAAIAATFVPRSLPSRSMTSSLAWGCSSICVSARSGSSLDGALYRRQTDEERRLAETVCLLVRSRWMGPCGGTLSVSRFSSSQSLMDFAVR